jgi:hypothetical protein
MSDNANDPTTAVVANHNWLGLPQGPRSVDLFDAWIYAENDVEVALGRWWAATSEHKGETYAVYVAALDREARAAEMLRLAVS